MKGYLQKGGKEQEMVRCPETDHRGALLLPLSLKEQAERILAEPRERLGSWKRSHPPGAITQLLSNCGGCGKGAWD